MPRHPREEVAGGLFHVYARGNDRRDIFVGIDDYRRYLVFLVRAVRRQRWNLLAFCLMPNHVHLLVETPEPNLARGMQRAHSGYAQDFNQRHGRSGHLFQGRYGAVRITTDPQLVAVARYIARNPVEAALAGAPGDWPWSSHRVAAGSDPAPSWLANDRLMELLSGWTRDPSGAYALLAAA